MLYICYWKVSIPLEVEGILILNSYLIYWELSRETSGKTHEISDFQSFTFLSIAIKISLLALLKLRACNPFCWDFSVTFGQEKKSMKFVFNTQNLMVKGIPKEQFDTNTNRLLLLLKKKEQQSRQVRRCTSVMYGTHTLKACKDTLYISVVSLRVG